MNMPKPFTKKRSQGALSATNVNNKKCEPMQNCFNLDDMMQFEAARQRALAHFVPENDSKLFNEFVANRIFINNVDLFNGSYYVKYLSQIKEPEIEGEGASDGEELGTEFPSTEEDNEEPNEETFEEDDNSSKDSSSVKPGKAQRRPSFSFELVGSIDFVNNPKYIKSEAIMELFDNEKKSQFLEKVLSCGVIIYDITSTLYCHPKQIEEAMWVAESIHRRLEYLEKSQPRVFQKYTDCRTLILVSTLLTWAKTKPIDPDDPTLPFTERDFRKRKAHPNYKVHCELEKKIIELGKKHPKHFRTIVIGSGVTYGHEEDVLHYLFKMAWKDHPHLPIFGTGKNIIPVIHINSLSSIIHNVIVKFPEKYHYLIAMDPESITLKEITKLLAKKLGNGKTLKVTSEEAMLYPDIKQRIYDMLTANINIVPGYILDKMTVNWATDRPLRENIENMITEFKAARGLLPVKIFMHGPPASGKTFLAKRLASYYDVPHLHVKGIIDETIQSLKDKIQAIREKNAKAEEKERLESEKVKIEGDEEGNEEDEDEEEDEEGDDIDVLNDNLREIEENMDNENNRLDEEFVIKFFKEKMLSNVCQNKGYIIDGYPKTMEATKLLYEPEGEIEMEADTEGQGTVTNLYNTAIMPDFVESLDASDEFLIERVIKMPEIDVQNTHYEEREMCRRLTHFRALNTEDNTPLVFYDEREVHPMIYNVEEDLDPNMNPTFQAIVSVIGPPKNYGDTSDELLKIIKQKRDAEEQKEYEDMKAQKEDIKKAAQERRDDLQQWMFLKNQELEMEEKALLVMGMPLRHYLMKYIFPTLTRGLVEVARLRPNDPIDFLSEFLFQENPEGKMFQPNFEEREEKLEMAIKEYENSLKNPPSRMSSVRTFSTEKSVRSGVISKVSSYKCSRVPSSASKKSLQSQSSKKSNKSESMGICTCGQKSPSLSTCSSDVTPSTPASCTCTFDQSSSCETPEEVDPCKCPC